MKFVGILMWAGLLIGCSDRQNEMLLGHWQSDETRTLLEMDLAKVAGRLTEQAEENEEFYRDGFFGRLRVHVEPGRSRSWFPDEGESADDVPWEAFGVEHIESNRYMFVGKDEQTGEVTTREFRIELEGQCYSVEIASLGFSEWFCRVSSH